MHTITNNYRDAHIPKPWLPVAIRASLFGHLKPGVSPKDPLPKERMFVLRPRWTLGRFQCVRACQGKPEVIDEIVFSATTQIMETFGKLFGQPQVLDLPVDEAGLKAWLERQKDGNPLEASSGMGRPDTRNATAKSVAAKVTR